MSGLEWVRVEKGIGAGRGCLLVDEDGFGAEGVVDGVVAGGQDFFIGGYGVGHLC